MTDTLQEHADPTLHKGEPLIQMTEVGKAYGAIRENIDNRNLFVVGPDGKIAYRSVPFREIDPTAYTELAAVAATASPA